MDNHLITLENGGLVSDYAEISKELLQSRYTENADFRL